MGGSLQPRRREENGGRDRDRSRSPRYFSSPAPNHNKNPPLSVNKSGVFGSDVNAAATSARTVVLSSLRRGCPLFAMTWLPSFRLKKSARVAMTAERRRSSKSVERRS